MKIGLQIYTLRDEMGIGYEEVYRQISEIGYTSVELTYDPGHADLVAELLKKYSLKANSAHISLDEIERNYETVKHTMNAVGAKDLIVPWVPANLVDTEEKAIEYAQRLEKNAAKVKEDGFILGFHNHTLEFEKKFDGKTIIDVFYDNAPSLKFEVDTGWAFAAGADVNAYLKKLGNRLSYIHIKDVDANNTPTEIGNGRVDFKTIIKTAEECGVEYGIVEQDSCVNYKPFEAIKISFENLKTINN